MSDPCLSFARDRLFSAHADLRVSLRKVRKRQRNPGAFQRLEGRCVSTLWFEETDQEIFGVRIGDGGRRHQRRARLPEPAKFMRQVLRGPTASALIPRSRRRESADRAARMELRAFTSAATQTALSAHFPGGDFPQVLDRPIRLVLFQLFQRVPAGGHRQHFGVNGAGAADVQVRVANHEHFVR